MKKLFPSMKIPIFYSHFNLKTCFISLYILAGFLKYNGIIIIMKHSITKMLGLAVFLLGFAFSMSGCAEQRYYDTNHHHTREWYDRHHTPPPAGVNFDVEVHQ
jgi:hypothetical protein